MLVKVGKSQLQFATFNSSSRLVCLYLYFLTSHSLKNCEHHQHQRRCKEIFACTERYFLIKIFHFLSPTSGENVKSPYTISLFSLSLSVLFFRVQCTTKCSFIFFCSNVECFMLQSLSLSRALQMNVGAFRAKCQRFFTD